MKKEIIFAIVLGLGLGLIVTFGIYTARNTIITHTTDVAATPIATPAATPADASLTVFSPDDESIQFDNDVKVTGTTFANSMVVIFINNTSNITQADASGNFSIETTLDAGSNVITIRALDQNGNQAEQQRTVIFTTPDLTGGPTATASATPSAKVK